MSSLSVGLACLGCIFLSLSLKRHYKQLRPDLHGFEQWCLPARIAGYFGIALSLWPCVVEQGVWIGVVVWLAILALAAFLQSMLLTYWPKGSVLFGSASLLLMLAGPTLGGVV